MDGLVSTGNKFPSTILKINFFNQTNFSNYFINILNIAVDKRTSNNITHCSNNTVSINYFINFYKILFFE